MGSSQRLQRLAILTILLFLPVFASPQVLPGDRETDPRVLSKLEWFQDQKFGLLMH